MARRERRREDPELVRVEPATDDGCAETVRGVISTTSRNPLSGCSVKGTPAVTRRTVSLTASTTYNLFMRVDVPGAFAGDFIEVTLDLHQVAPGDFVTAECVRQGNRLVALTVTVAERE